jgi:hypothetical protein
MKKLIFLAMALFFVFASLPNSYAKTYYRTFEVAEILSDGIVLTDFEGGRYKVDKDPNSIKGGLKVGDSVRYDTVRNVLKKNPWQPATITKMDDRFITMQFKNGDTIDLVMQSKYQGKYKKGDQVFYKAASKQIKKSNLQPLEDQ